MPYRNREISRPRHKYLKRNSSRSAVFAAVAMLGVPAGVGLTLRAVGQNQPPKLPAPAPQTPAATKNDHYVDLTMIDVKQDEKTSISAGRNFTYHDPDNGLTVTGDKARYNKKTSELDAEGHLVMDDEKHHATGEKAHVDNSKGKKLAIITGSVVVVVKPSAPDDTPTPPPAPPMNGEVKVAPVTPPGDSAAAGSSGSEKEDVGAERKRGVTIYCDRMEVLYKKKYTTMRGHVVFKQTIRKEGKAVERTLTAEHAEFDSKNDKLLLFAPVDGSDTDKQELHFTTNVTVGTKAGEETLTSEGHSTFKIIVPNDDEEETPPSEKASPKKPGEPGKPGDKK